MSEKLTSDVCQNIRRRKLAERIRVFRSVSKKNDPLGWYRRAAFECLRGDRSYNRTFGIGKSVKK